LYNDPHTECHHQLSGDLPEESLHTVKTWLQMCETEHSKCNEEQAQPPFYPTRLLELNGVSSTADYVRLIVSEHETMTGAYTTLSHQWGKANFLQLKRDNINHFLDAIAIKDLPKTFQDAINVSRKLGIHYLWIDSLCIMQDKDDLSDWFHEAELMHKVYSHSYCNLSATDGVNSSDGLYHSRYAHNIRETKVNLYVRHHNDQVDRSASLVLEDTDRMWNRFVVQTAFHKRGWVFQERVLSPRVLHFGRHQLFWECRESQRQEKHPDELKLNFSAKWNTKSFWEKPFVNDEKDHSLTWQSMITAYSGTNLTVSDDKLIALSGVAKRFASMTGDTYVAGLWRRSLERELLWYLNDAVKRSPRPTQYCAPSWSWASVKGQVDFLYVMREDSLSMRVEDVRLTYATQDITGRITSGWLDLEGNLRTFRVWKQGDENYVLDPRRIVMIGDHYDRFVMEVWQDALEPRLPDSERDNDQGNFYCLQATGTYGIRVSFLLLQSDPSRKGWFQRVGLGSIWPESSSDEVKLSEALDKHADTNLPSLHHDGRLHSIRIF
jgi:hypothetical protein